MSPLTLSSLYQSLRGLLAAEALGFVIAAALILALVFVLPAGTRRRARTPLLLLIASFLVLLLRPLVNPDTQTGRALPIIGLFFLSAAIGQAAFLILVDSILGKRRAQPLPRIFRDIVQGVMLVAVVLITLRAAGVAPTSLLTTSALLTAVIGLSLQDTLGNLFAGLSIQAQQPFEVGDWIQIDPDARLVGRVIEINWRATTVLTGEQVELIIPNGMLAKSTIRNFTKPNGISKRTIEVQAPYEVKPQLVERTLLSAVHGINGLRSDPAPSVLLSKFADSSVAYNLTFFIDDFTQRDRIDSTVRQRVWFALQRAGIAIPFPTRMMVQSQDASSTEARAKLEASEQAQRLASIKKVDFLAALPEAALERLAALSKTCQYLAGEVIIRQGDTGHELYIVRSGEVIVLLGRNEGSVAELARLGPGKFFGEMSLMTGERRAATVQATFDCELIRIDKEAFQEILAADPQLIEQVTKVLVERQIEMEENINARAARSKTYKEEKSHALVAAIKEFFSL